MSQPLWRPSEERRQDANLIRFMEDVAARWSVRFNAYGPLYQWSIENPEKFWLSMWEFAGIIAETQGERVLIDGDKMPGARWFPDAKLNYAENMLRRRDMADAMVFWGEAEVRRRGRGDGRRGA